MKGFELMLYECVSFPMLGWVSAVIRPACSQVIVYIIFISVSCSI